MGHHLSTPSTRTLSRRLTRGLTRPLALALACALAPSLCLAQQTGSSAAKPDCSSLVVATADHTGMDHDAHRASIERCAAGVTATMPGQAAFGAIGEIVGILKADSNTEWGKVNIEALRQHLVDMNDVIMESAAAQRNIAGGIILDITGTGRTTAAIRRMVPNHARVLEQGSDYRASAIEIPGGVRLTITSRVPGDANAVARVRALGFAGIITEGDHHRAHHLAIARGEVVHGH